MKPSTKKLKNETRHPEPPHQSGGLITGSTAGDHNNPTNPPEFISGSNSNINPFNRHPELVSGSNANLDFNSSLFNFHEILHFLQKFGKQQYGPNFKIYDEDHEIIFKLLIYFFQDKENCEKRDLQLKKGILLSGPVGCGKTSLMSLLRYIFPPPHQHIMISTRKVTFEFIDDGYKVIQKYTTGSFKLTSDKWIPKTYCFDDLGVESEIKHYGNKCNIMAEILLSRYDLFISHGMKTHITTNLSASEIEEYYGNRVRSRMREMFNLMAFTKDSCDKRK